MESEKNRSVISEGLIIAALSVYGYLLAFVYEAGIASVYGYPYTWISIRLESVFVALAGFAGAWAIPYGLLNIGLSLTSQGTGALSRSLKVGVFVATMIIFSFLALGLSAEAFFISGVWSLFLILEFVFPLIAQRKVKGYSQKLEAQEERESSLQFLPHFLNERLGRNKMLFFWCCLIFLGLASLMGINHARTKSEYLVLKQETELFVLREFGDRLICSPADTPPWLSPPKRFVVVDLGQSEQLTFFKVSHK